MSETQQRDARRAQIMGKAWLSQWIEQGRGRNSEGAASWIFRLEEYEEALYSWIWVPPYLDKETSVDEYRGQHAGKTMLTRFAQGLSLTSSAFWMIRAKEEAAKTEEQWLFLDPILEMDGWKRTKTEEGVPAWTKADGDTPSPPQTS